MFQGGGQTEAARHRCHNHPEEIREDGEFPFHLSRPGRFPNAGEIWTVFVLIFLGRLSNAGEFVVLIFLERLLPQMRKVEGSPAALARDWKLPKPKRWLLPIIFLECLAVFSV